MPSAAYGRSVAASPPQSRSSVPRSARSGSEDGQALVEFALVLPIVVVVLFGILLFGIALNDWIDETQLVSEAARFAAVNHNPCEAEKLSLIACIRKQGDNSNVREAAATMCSPPQELNGVKNEGSVVGDWVEAKLTYPYNWFKASKIFELFGQGNFNAETPITSTAQMRIEVTPTTAYSKTC